MLADVQGTTSGRVAPRLRTVAVAAAENLATTLLAPTQDRLRHTEGVASRAEFLTAVVEVGQAHTLVAAAWLHDIGYAEELRKTGFHPLDGASFLERSGWPPEIYNLVAHHSGARFLASAAGLDSQIGRYIFTADRLSDALTVADQITGPHGELVTIEQRLADQLRRHGADSSYARAYSRRSPYIRSCALRIVALLQRRSLTLGLE